MCGLISIIAKKPMGFTQKELTFFKQGLYTTALRGMDSTGIFSIKKSGNIFGFKDAIPSSEFIESKEYDLFETSAYVDGRILVGHCRSATKGIKTKENAHPFLTGNTILVHNGTIYNHQSLANTNTDSEAIAIALDKEEPLKIIPKLLGAFALIWYNIKKKHFYITRNEERPLWIIQEDNFDYIGSEPKQLEWLYYRTYQKNVSAKYFAPHNLFTWELDKLDEGFEKDPIEKKKLPTIPSTYTTNIIPTGETKPILLYEDIHYSDIIQIKIKSITHTNTTCSIIFGTHENYPEITFKAYLYNSNEKEQRVLDTCIYIKGKASGKSISTTENIIYLTSVILIPKTNTIFLVDKYGTKKEINLTSAICSRCHAPITQKDNSKIWFRIKQNKVKTIYCPSCTTNNTNLK